MYLKKVEAIMSWKVLKTIQGFVKFYPIFIKKNLK